MNKVKFINIHRSRNKSTSEHSYPHCLTGTIEVRGVQSPFKVTYLKTNGHTARDANKVHAVLELRKWKSGLDSHGRCRIEAFSQADCPKCGYEIPIDPFIPYIEEASSRHVCLNRHRDSGWLFVHAAIQVKYRRDLHQRRGKDMVVIYQEHEGECPIHGRVMCVDTEVAD